MDTTGTTDSHNEWQFIDFHLNTNIKNILSN